MAKVMVAKGIGEQLGLVGEGPWPCILTVDADGGLWLESDVQNKDNPADIPIIIKPPLPYEDGGDPHNPEDPVQE